LPELDRAIGAGGKGGAAVGGERGRPDPIGVAVHLGELSALTEVPQADAAAQVAGEETRTVSAARQREDGQQAAFEITHDPTGAEVPDVDGAIGGMDDPM